MQEETDVIYDVIVLGGGFRALGAAFSLAENRKRVLVVEPHPTLGWEATWAYILELQKGISKYADILASQIAGAGGMSGPRIDPVITELAILKMMNNIKILHYCWPSGFVVENNRIQAIAMAGKSGPFYLQAKLFIDATENEISKLFIGREGTVEQVPKYIHGFFMNGVDTGKSLPEKLEYEDSLLLFKNTPWDGEISVSFETSGPVHHAILEIPEILRFLRKEVGAVKNAVLSHSANMGLPLYSAKTVRAIRRHNMMENLVYPSRKETATLQEHRLLLSERMKEGEDVAVSLIREMDGFSAPSEFGKSAVPVIMPRDKGGSNIIVCGGGTAGALAAISAGRLGQKTMLIEASTCLGGIGTGGSIHLYYYGVAGGLQDEVDQKVAELHSLYCADKTIVGFHPEIKKTVLLRMALEAGVSIEFETMLTGVETDSTVEHVTAGNKKDAPVKVKSVIVNSSVGPLRYNAEIFIDSTGDADLTVMAGGRYSFGRDSDSIPLSYSQPSDSILEDKSIAVNNFDAGYCDPTDPWDLTRARIKGLKQYEEIASDNRARLISLSPLIGVRSSRLVCGKYRLTLADQLKASEFKDVVAYSVGHYDNHAADYENESDEVMVWVWCLGNWSVPIGCEIPYRCLLPEKITNLLVACRALSLEYDAHSQMRMQRDMQRIGEVAGIAAAISCIDKKAPSEIDIEKLQEKLFESGALQDQSLKYHSDKWKPNSLFQAQLKNNSIVAHENALEIIKSSFDLDMLKHQLSSEKPEEKFNAALKLVMINDKEARDVLIDCIRSHPSCKTTGHRTVEVWKPAMILAGIFKIREAIPFLNKAVLDTNSDQATLIIAMKALVRLEEKPSARLIEEMLCRNNLPALQKFHSSSKYPVSQEESLWKLELAAAESLAALGVKRSDIIQKYISDPRAIVRRFARQIKEKTGL